jgi:dTDP-L-rhamnose 4-epimerase
MDLINHYFSVNVNGTATMVEAIQRNKSEVKHIILSSSRAVYGAGVNSEDNKVLDPLSIYGVTKLVQEQCLKLSSPSPLTILRFQNVYGPGQSLINSYTGIISIFFERMRKNLPISIYDKGLPTRDFVFVEDISDAIIACLFNAKAIGKTYNVGTGKKQLILEVAQILKTLLGSSSEISVTDYHRPGDVIAIDSHVDLISAELGWKHKVEVQEGLRKFIEWALAEHAAS